MEQVNEYFTTILENVEQELTKLSSLNKLFECDAPLVNIKRRIYDELILTLNEQLKDELTKDDLTKDDLTKDDLTKDDLTKDDLYYCKTYLDIWFTNRVETINK